MLTVVVIGLGNMGGPMATHLVEAGHTVLGIDPSPAAQGAAEQGGVRVVEDTAGAVRTADVVLTMLPNGAVVEQVLTGPDGVLAHLRPGALVVDSSTIGVATAQEMHAAAAGLGHRYLDAPVSGGITGARAATLTFMAGGDAEVVEAARPLLLAMGARVVHAGGPGLGAAAKIVNNMLLGISLAGVCEAFVLAERLGLEHQTFYDIASTSSGDCWALRTWTPVPGVVEGTPSNDGWRPGFSTALMSKDMQLALAEGEQSASDLAMAQTAAGLYRELATTAADLDCSALIELVRGQDRP